MSFSNIASAPANQLSAEVNNFKTIWESKVKKNADNLKDPRIRNTVKNSMKQLEKLNTAISSKIGNDAKAHAVFDTPFNEYNQRKTNILQLIQKLDDEERAQKAATEAKVLQQTEGNVDQLQVQQDAEDLSFIHEQTQEIVTEMQALKEITEQVNDKIQADHETVVRIDNKIEEAKVDMVEGNKELEKAEDDQKKTCQIC